MTTKINQTIQGQKQAYWIEEDGNGRWKGYYVNNEREGTWCFFRGQIIRKMVRYVKGSKDGQGFVFSANGCLTLILPFEQDRIHGKARFYAEDGTHLATYDYVYDKLNQVEHYLIHEDSPPKYHTYLPEF